MSSASRGTDRQSWCARDTISIHHRRASLSAEASVGRHEAASFAQYVEKEYRVDTNRVYLTGMSMGGAGTWSLGLTQAKRFAAIAPICGNVKPDFLKKLTPEQTEAIKSLPVWAFHGAKDTTVLPWHQNEWSRR